jgi:hypothetical protein
LQWVRGTVPFVTTTARNVRTLQNDQRDWLLNKQVSGGIVLAILIQ